MKNHFKITIIIIALFLLMSPMIFADDSTLTLMLDDEVLTMPIEPFEFNGEILVDSQSIFEALGLSVEYYQKTHEIVGYRNNIFVKIQAGSNIATKNGKTFTMPVNGKVYYVTGEFIEDQGLLALDTRTGIIYDKERLFAPLSFIVDMFDIDIEWMDAQTIMLQQYQNNTTSKYILNNLFIEYSLTDIDGVIYIPEYWTKVEGQENTFSYSDDFESFTLKIQNLEVDTTDLRQLDEDIKSSELILYGDNLSLTGTQTKPLIGHTPLVSYSTLTTDAATINRVRYLITIRDYIYVIEGTYNHMAVESSTIKMFDSIVSSFTLSNINIDTDEEFFFQSDRFFELETVLNEEIYSNMDINGSLKLSGNFGTNTKIEKMRVTVEKDAQSKTFVVPVENNSFDYTIYTPFKLGKHNISISIPKENESTPVLSPEYLATNIEDYSEYSFKLRALVNSIETYYSDSSNYDDILKLSVINTSAKDSLYLLPNEYVNSENTQLYNSAISVKPSDEIGDYYHAKAIFKSILNNYTLDKTDKDFLKTSDEVFTSKSGNELELANLYAAMLRSMDIPARVVRGTTLNSDEYWTEIYINGKWQISNIGWALKFKILTDTRPYRFFDITSSDMQSLQNIYVLPF